MGMGRGMTATEKQEPGCALTPLGVSFARRETLLDLVGTLDRGKLVFHAERARNSVLGLSLGPAYSRGHERLQHSTRSAASGSGSECSPWCDRVRNRPLGVEKS